MAALGPLIPLASLAFSFFTKPKSQPLPAIPPLADIPGRETSDEIAKAADQERRRRLSATGRAQTILGGQVGEPLQKKALFGE